MLGACVATGVRRGNRSFFTPAAVTVMREQFEGVGVGESSMSAEEGEFAFGELLFPKISEFLDKRVFSRHDFGKIETEFVVVNAPNFSLTRQVHDFGSVEQSFGRHAAAQNAKPADVLPAFNHDGFDPGRTGRASRGVTGAAAADNSELEIEMAPCLAHVLSMGHGRSPGKGVGARTFLSAAMHECGDARKIIQTLEKPDDAADKNVDKNVRAPGLLQQALAGRGRSED